LLTADLGSASLVLNASGNKVAESRHYPYGVERWSSGTLPTDYRFTGQRFEAGLGIYAMGARWYDPYINRWLSADTLVPDPASPQGFNRYSYTRNNPLNFVDPTGHKEEGECGPNGEDCIDVSALWDQFWLQYVGDPEAAEQAFLLFLADPQYFISLYTNPAAWAASQEVADLDVFLQYSSLHTTAASFMASLFDSDTAGSIQAAHMLYGMGDEAGADDLLTAAGFGVLGIAGAVYRGGSYNSIRAPGLQAHHLWAANESPLSCGEGPAIQMDPFDHMQTASWGRGAADVWRQQQGALMRAGQMRDALTAAIKDIRGQFGSKYNSAIQEAIRYARGAGWIDKRR
jgi:RHS repeat-associated protein